MDIEKYEFDIYMQQVLLGAMLKDVYFLKQSSSLMCPNYFQDNSHVAICSIILDFFDKYKQIPKAEYIEQEIKEKYHDNNVRRDAYIVELKTILHCYEPGIETREYLTDKISEFAKIQTMRKAIVEVTDILGKKHEDKWSKIYNILTNALNVEKMDDEALDYFNTVEERYVRLLEIKSKGETFTSGFKTIDDALTSGGLGRGEIGSFMGQSGVGKSVALTKAAVHNVARGKKVLYVTLEMSADKTALRMDSQFSQIALQELFQNKEEVFDVLREQVAGHLDKKLLLVKQFPAGTLDIKKLRAYLSQLSLDGFKPDLLIIDYIAEMFIPNNIPLHDALYYIIRDLRGLAVEENICIFSAIQANRGGKDVIDSGGVIDDRYIGSSYAIIKPLDALWSLNQSIHERKAGVGRIFVVKHRDGKGGFPFCYKQTDNLDLVEISHDVYAAKMNAVSELAASDSVVSLSKKIKYVKN